MSDIPFKNPGWAGNTGEFELTEEQVRGDDFVGTRPAHGGHASGAGTMPYMLAEKEPDAPLFEGEYRDRLDKILSRYPTKQAALLPALGLAQEIRGHISPASMDEVAEALELSSAYVRGVATFYTMYKQRPMGKYHIQVCTTLSCMLRGCDELLEHLQNRLGIKPGEVTEDGRFSLVQVECLASCGTAPMLQLNDDYHEDLTLEQVDRLLDGLP